MIIVIFWHKINAFKWLIHWSIAAIGLKGAYAKHRLAGANDIDINLGDATLAAMTNLEYDKSGNNNETEEEEQEVYGIFTGFWMRDLIHYIFMHNNKRYE